MNIKPKQIKKNLKKAIAEVVNESQKHVKNPEKDFCRNRKLPFEKVLTSVLAMSSKDLKCELLDIFKYAETTPTVSAFVQQRSKIKPSAFETVFKKFTASIKARETFKGYRLIAVDGSYLRTPTNKDEINSYHPSRAGRRPYNIMHLNVLYDLKNHIYVDAIVQSGLKNHERKAFNTMVDRDSSPIPTIYIADRGYESYNVFAHIQEKNQFFLIRIKDVLSVKGIARGLDLPNHDEFDVCCDVNLTRKESLAKKEHTFKRFARNGSLDYLPFLSESNSGVDSYHVPLRLVRIKISDDKYEILATNLPQDSFSPDDLSALYVMRWGIETSFRSLKYTLGLIYFHSKKEENIIQEVFAKLTMYNFSELITANVIIRKNRGKHIYKVNFSASVHICRSFFLNNISPNSVEAIISKYVIPIRCFGSYPRIKKPKSSVCFLYRVA